jgi:hypothetical protein
VPVETRWGYADDREWAVVQPNGPPNHMRIAAEVCLPQAVRDHHHGLRRGDAILCGIEAAAEEHSRAEHGEVIAGYGEAVDAVDEIAGAEAERLAGGPVRRQAVEDLIAIAVVGVVRIRLVSELLRAERTADLDQP